MTTDTTSNNDLTYMEAVESKSKIYESISIKHDPHYESALKAVAIIKDFIRSRKLIIYGGSAVDYALRLHGDNIYPDEMLALPDLDFYSPDSVSDAYDLTKILYNAGFTNARTIVGMYVLTMRVDIIDNHFLADISYVPKKIFETLPTLEYEGMKIIDPIFQKIDFHSCLAFPFDNPPREVIFEKWKKYIERFNKMHKYYPTPSMSSKSKLSPVTFKCEKISSVLLDGFAAYGAILRSLMQMHNAIGVGGRKPQIKLPAEILPCEFSISGNSITCDTLDDTINVAHFDTDICIKLLNITDIQYYASYINIMMKHLEGKTNGKSSDVKFVVTSTENKLISVHRITIDDTLVATVGIQFVLLRFLVSAHMSTGRTRATYYAYYDSLMAIIEHAERLISMMPDNEQRKALIANAPFFPTVKVFGSSNNSAAYTISINRIKADLGETVNMPLTPKGFYPAKSQITEKFDYESSDYFIKDGRLLTKMETQ